jgi:hypothetical protein
MTAIVLEPGFALNIYMDNSLLRAFFGCSHSKTTFPQTPVRRGRISALPTESKAQTYIACLDCGKEIPYDWDKMQKIRHSRLARPIQAFRRAAFGFR